MVLSAPGEVYKANDTRLDRTVAIKVLPEHLAGSAELKQRFEREAKAISQLNHPRICTLYDVGEQDGVDYLVMEFIEGETLAAKLTKGALPLGKALDYGAQIADGLDRAHGAGIVHRDLKPGNVMLTVSGIKLLDFGLAKRVVDARVSDSSDAPTRAQQENLTGEQAVVGTLQYMAPEQLEGKMSPDGTRLAFQTRLAYQSSQAETGADIWILSIEEQTASPFLATSANEDWPMFSPDGQWIAYESDESGQREVYLTTYLGAGQKRQVSIAGGGKPRWRSDGSELFYISEDKELMAVPVATTPTLQLGTPHALFEMSDRDYDVHPSGERFLIVRTEREARPGQINVVLNWFEELERLVPTND